jgi:hypothetical protein
LRRREADVKIFSEADRLSILKNISAEKSGRQMPKPTVAALSLDTLLEEPAARTVSQNSDLTYLVSVGLVAALIIGVFFGISLSLIATQTEEQIIVGSATGNRGSGINPLRSDDLQVPQTDAQSIPIDPGLPPAPGAASVPVSALAQAPAPSSAPPGDVAPVTSAIDGSSSAEARQEPPTAPRAIGLSQEIGSNPPATNVPAAPQASPPSAAEVAELLARGDSFVLVGDIASARVFYQRAADAGDGRGALRMGATFDPAFLARAGLDSTSGDPAIARSWYRRVLDLDPEQAGQRHKRVATK